MWNRLSVLSRLAGKAWPKQKPSSLYLQISSWNQANAMSTNMCSSKQFLQYKSAPSNIGLHNMQLSRIHTKGERELTEFLSEEIVAEKKAQKSKSVPSEVDGFKVKLDGSEVELIKTNDKEKIIVSFNINHTVDTEEEAEVDPTVDKPEFGEMKSKPTFEVDIVKGSTTLSFTCSFLQGTPQEGEYNDIFGIDEITLYENEWKEKYYAVAGDVLDGYLYDLLMNLLEEKGISNEFVEKLSAFSTAYENSAYIGLLEGLSKFITSK